MKNIDISLFKKICSESKTMSEAANKLNMHFNTFKRYAIKYNCYNPKLNGRKKYIYDLEDILNGKYSNYQSYKLKNKLIKAGLKENKCECCGITEWNNKPINFELHHIDGNRSNNSLSNLQILCPNCHSQTDNFRAKNI